MKTKAQKRKVVEGLNKKFPAASFIAFTSFSRTGEGGLSVSKMQELKRLLRSLGGEYVVAKKNLIRVSAEQSGLGDQVKVDSFEGSLGLVLGGGATDGAALSKKVYDFSKSHPVFKVLGAILESKYLDADGFMVLAKLPAKEVMRSQLLGVMQYPIRGLVNVLHGNIRNFLVVLKNIKKSSSLNPLSR